MRKLIVAIFVILFAAPVFGTEVDVTIHVDGDYRPFSYSDHGKARGIYIDILQTAFSRMPGFKVKIEPVPWKRGKKMMENGQGFGLAPAFFHGHDWPYLYPYSLPIYTETIITVCQERVLESPRTKWPVDYIGLRIGNVAGFDGWGGEAFRKLVRLGKIHYEETKGSRENLLKLASGRLDCIMMEEKAFDYLFRQLKKTGKYIEGRHMPLKKGAVVGQDPVYIGYSKPAISAGAYPFQLEFRQAFDAIIYDMTKSGEIPKIIDAYQD